MPVITITGLYGAGRETIGAMVAEQLDAELVDRKIFTEVSRRLDLADDEVEAQEETPASLLDRVLAALGASSADFSQPPEAAWAPPYEDVPYDTRKAVLRITQEVIREAARTGNAVIVGRGSAMVLADRLLTLHVFLHGPEADRLASVRRTSNLGEQEARKLLRHTDENRGAYLRQVYGADWRRPQHYQLLLDSSWLGWERTAKIIVSASRAHLGPAERPSGAPGPPLH
ncbi:MAG: cytidylate kinase-like family protein [Candidatus Dormibacteraeota bacterium]|nr:cytidylate kinase-like family protein [Candidatus Dormibacteraeota bacterium]